MPSSYSSNLRLTLMANGENANTWGTITNTNWNLIEQKASSYLSVALADGQNVLTANNGSSDQNRRAALAFTGALTTATSVVVAAGASNWWFMKNSTTGVSSIRVKTSGNTGYALPNDGQFYALVTDGTSVFSAAGVPGTVSVSALTANTLTANSFYSPAVSITGGAINGTTIGGTSAAAGTFSAVNAPSIHVTGVSAGYVGLQAPTSVTSLTFTLPGTDGTSGQVLQTNGSGILSFASTLGRILNVQGFSSSGTYTKTAGTNSVLVFCAGPSGGGGSGDGGGSTPSAGSGASSFGSHCSAGAGGAGTNGSTTNGAPGTRGTASGGIVNVTGGGPSGGAGAIRYRGSDTGTQGSDGGPGALSIAYITSSIGATETVTIGTGGSGGSGTYAGNDGANGWVLVIELA